ncbi:hypothetical protein C5167_018005 [Papaver somniferum]|uniref:Uncharacterized protein n=1 Tax=Papaver somniferum TaxID=3469 RepID=A0A4Y7IQ06_PAPSO|nr:RNA-binding protein 12-like [Papaver somniferum]RZC49579.1 hypothetical protein C5167_018005 [Papaver somniferum]
MASYKIFFVLSMIIAVSFINFSSAARHLLQAPTALPSIPTISTIPTVPANPTIPTMPTIPAMPTIPTIPTVTPLPTVLPTVPNFTLPPLSAIQSTISSLFPNGIPFLTPSPSATTSSTTSP